MNMEFPQQNRKIFDYTLSATKYGIIPAGTITGDYAEFEVPFSKGILVFSDILHQNIKKECINTNPLVSILFNAFYEPQNVDEYKKLEKLHMDSIYADSGGLQIITAGKTITPELKQQVYDVQTYADYAMCFDVIPLISTSKERTKNERSNIFNKRFVKEDFDTAGQATAANIKEQVETFKKKDAHTKVLIIVQGNTAENMLAFYRHIDKALSGDDWNYIGGLAVADTCMGNGILESIEMLQAAKLISDECHPSVTQQLHLLGIGSLDRIRPVVYLAASGYLDKFKKISYDSSTHTSSFDYGSLRVDGKTFKLGQYKTLEAEQHFRKVYDMFSEYLNTFTTSDEFINLLFGEGEYNTKATEWKHSQIKKRAKDFGDVEKGVVALFAKPMHTFYQVDSFVKNVDKLWNEKVPSTNRKNITMFRSLRAIKDNETMNMWMKEFSSSVASKRIKSSAPNSLKEFLDD